jgi:tRNA1(Val) A37 N6-methylase TrmN6
MSDKYSESSYSLTKQLSKVDKRTQGIFFSPPKCILNIIAKLDSYLECENTEPLDILEPSCGSGEFISKLRAKYAESRILGIENNKTIFESVKKYNTENTNTIIVNADFLKYDLNKKFNLIIGNPPYFVMKNILVEKKYKDYYTGRPNIFIIFILKCLSLLKPNGVLAFVLPKSFLNCVYYDKTRAYIHHNFEILDIFESNDKYIETAQPTVVFMLKNSGIVAGNERFVLEKNGFTVFGSEGHIEELTELYKDSKTLNQLGFKVSVGKVVWNQCKSILTDDKTKTRLIYSSDIVNKELSMKEYSNPQKKNYIDKPGINTPMMIINRGYGVGKYVFNYCILDGSIKYLIENHLICIEYKKKLTKSKLMKRFNKIAESFENEKTKKFINLYFGNSAINTTELAHILPVYNL